MSTSSEELVRRLSDTFAETTEQVVPWFLSVMPPSYFRDTDLRSREAHIGALIAARASEQPLSLTLQRDDGSEVTFIHAQDRRGLLGALLKRLPKGKRLSSAKVHTSNDGALVVDVFRFGGAAYVDMGNPEHEALLSPFRAHALEANGGEVDAAFERHLTRCSLSYLNTISPARSWMHWRQIQAVEGTEAAVAHLEQDLLEPDLWRVTITVDRAQPRTLLERFSHHFGSRGVDIRRAYLDLFDERGPADDPEEPATGRALAVLSFVVAPPEDEELDAGSPLWAELSRACGRLKWLDDRVLARSGAEHAFDVLAAEMQVALCDLAHQSLTKRDRHGFSRARILEAADRHPQVVMPLVQALISRFDPQETLAEEDFLAQVDAIEATLPMLVDAPEARQVMVTLTRAVKAVLKTNVHREGRYALSFRLDPAFLTDADDPNRAVLPYGVFFVHGRGFDGFHVRFRDIARGGIRAVRSRNPEHHFREAQRLYDEVYGLAFAQQLKNKDIPEGGSKGVMLLEPNVDVESSVKAFGDALLDLLVPATEPVPDRLGRPEILYLGPDENIADDYIVWLVERARSRGYPLPDVFMSSKPGAGINHKRYGVTSEGVTVFLEVALNAIGIDPRTTPFTVSLTGGPDGDVAGNEIKILHREFGEHAHIVGIADGSGSAEDPEGLDHGELLRLVAEGLPIADFDPSHLSPRGQVVPLSAPEGAHRRNTLHERLTVDAFLPCGGRPGTIHEGNWRSFLDAGGRPRAKLIVEGANLFLTKGAREALSAEAGVLVVKDSSANKCGVICSSFEIAAGMLVSAEAFMAIKDVFVEQVLHRLRAVARQEAEALFRTHRLDPSQSLARTSIRLSRAINTLGDAIFTGLGQVGDEGQSRMMPLVRSHLPQVLLSTAGEAAVAGLPQAYLHRVMAARLAADIVYREGLGFVESLDPSALGPLAFGYLEEAQKVAALVEELQGAELPNRDAIIELLRAGGARTALASRR
ncbi:MAG: NAD-glutamate dehydrogenase domain-containing protein [Bradymonadia bacterium]